MIESWWEASDNPAFVAYRCYWTTLPVFETYKPKAVETLPLFDWAGIVVDMDESDDIEFLREAGRMRYKMRLPYTAVMYQRWLERQEAEARAIMEGEHV